MVVFEDFLCDGVLFVEDVVDFGVDFLLCVFVDVGCFGYVVVEEDFVFVFGVDYGVE